MSYQPTRGDEGVVSVVVSDTGIGLTDTEIKNLFQPFVRGESRAVQKVQGSGLGLALSRRLAQILGGDLRLLRTSPNGGSDFELTISVNAKPELKLVHKQNSSPLTPLAGSSFLIVEDDADLRELISRYLADLGAQIETCENGQEAIEATKTSVFDIILMDMKMPIKNGYETTRELRAKGYVGPIIAITAFANSEDRQRCYQAGCDEYLSKPIDPQHLFATVANRIHFARDLIV